MKEKIVKIQSEYKGIRKDLIASNKQGLNDLYGKGYKAGLKFALDILEDKTA